VSEVEVAASLGLVAGEGGCVAGAVLFNDVAIPHESYYRPPVKFRCVDGFLGVGDAVSAGHGPVWRLARWCWSCA
jgi:5-oxopent-3-ene-1,2,5-tricarboxylate decarboxylase / 2-hydroxyhepta-2,4-diene-1,7-dioate isomerase